LPYVGVSLPTMSIPQCWRGHDGAINYTSYAGAIVL
jgi:hypothetical protein